VAASHMLQTSQAFTAMLDMTLNVKLNVKQHVGICSASKRKCVAHSNHEPRTNLERAQKLFFRFIEASLLKTDRAPLEQLDLANVSFKEINENNSWNMIGIAGSPE
jgi:hypothetical protein